ncbi:MAG TPA: translation elongation factor Ts, partial [Kiloniellaceae bacterium]
VGVAAEGTRGAVVEVNSETDFVARNENFQDFVRKVAGVALEVGGDIEAAKAARFPGSGNPVSDELTGMIAKIGENMSLRRAAGVTVGNGVVCSYIHNQTAPGVGKIGVLIGLESGGDKAKLEALGRQLAMHVAAARPQALDRSGVDASALEREREVLSEQARASGKQEDIIAKMVEGRLRKFYEEVVLLEQVYVIDGETKITKVLEAAAKDVGAPVAIAGFARIQLGEGIEREEQDFAAEVAATLGG